MSEPSDGPDAAAAPVVEVPVDLVEFEARLLTLERRLREREACDQALLGVVEALRRLTEALGPLLQVVRPLVESGDAADHASPNAPFPGPPKTLSPPPSLAPPPAWSPVPPSGLAPAPNSPRAPTPPSAPLRPPSSGPPHEVQPERLALAQARMREAATDALRPPPVLLSAPPPGRRSWLLRSLRRMVARDPDAAGRLLVALLPAHRVAGIEPVPRLPGPPATVARVVARGRLRRRLGWEMAQLECELTTVSALAKLVRMRASAAQLNAAGVRLDPPLALALVAFAIDPRWTLGHRFTLAHLDARAAYLEVRDGARPSVTTERPRGPIATTLRCSADALVALLAGEPGVAATVEGERRPLELVRGWFADATGA